MGKLRSFLIAVIIFAVSFGLLSLLVPMDIKPLLLMVPLLAAGEVFVVQPLVAMGKPGGGSVNFYFL